jgi:KipI family sensor histidine kinase inhibitor
MKDEHPEPVIQPLGDRAFLIRLGDRIDPAINRRVHDWANALAAGDIPGFAGVIPAYADLVVLYDPESTDWKTFLGKLRKNGAMTMQSLPDQDKEETLEVPVFYGDEWGPDLGVVATRSGLEPEEVVRLHTQPVYFVYMMGFTPGFCYLGGLDNRLSTPRKSSPRLKIPAGSVGIAGDQTGIYPIESPGGWQIVGRTPVRLFDPGSEEPFLFRAGRKLRFRAVPPGTPWPAGNDATGGMEPAIPAQPGSPSMIILSPGPLTSIQDEGRFGYADCGMPAAGALDRGAMHRANKRVGNERGEAVLEITFLGPEIEFVGDQLVALAGADLQPRLNGSPIGREEAFGVKSGDRLSFGGMHSGLRTYLAVGGGFDIPPVMGSRSTYLRGGIGGYRGRALMPGDRIPVRQQGVNPAGAGLTGPPDPEPAMEQGFDGSFGIRFIPGPEADRFSPEGIRTFLTSAFPLSADSDRMGIRLGGPAVEHLAGADILSSGVIPGTIQIPGDGHPIILMNDCQTTGGYARIGCVIRKDLDLLAQIRPGQEIRFVSCRLDDPDGW